MSLKTQFKFHPIGQGCFYTGSIAHGKQKAFHFVYDCGTYSKHTNLQRAISEFKSELIENLDLLMISHFDNDHINEVIRLLRNPGIHCRRLIIPYYKPFERLFLYTSSGNRDEEYRRMMLNPVQYFSDFNIDEIIIVGAPDDNVMAEDAVNRILPGNFPALPRAEADELLPFEDFYDENESMNFRKNLPAEEAVNSPKVKFILAPYRLALGKAVWEFVFYLKKGDKTSLTMKFTEAVDELMKDYNSIYDLFDEEPVKHIKKFYKEIIRGAMNSTSLVTYHGPAFSPDHPDYSHFSNLQNNSCLYGTLLTGDIDLDGKVKMSRLVSYFKNYLSRVLVFQVPHHGSKENWAIQKTPHALHGFKHYVINHGLGREHHPSADVVADIQEHCPDAAIHLSNEVNDFVYSFEYMHKLELVTLAKPMEGVEPIKLKGKSDIERKEGKNTLFD